MISDYEKLIKYYSNVITISTHKGHIRFCECILKSSIYEISNIQIYEKDNYSE